MVPGVRWADLNFASGMLVIEYDADGDPRERVVAVVERSGHDLVPLVGAEAMQERPENWLRENRTLVVVSGSSLLAALGGMLGFAAGSAGALSSALYVASNVAYLCAVVVGFTMLLPRAVASLRARSVDMNVLMIVAVVGALFLRQYSEAAAVVVLFSLGGWLESRAVAKTRNSIRDLMDLAPPVARVRRGGEIVTVSPGDVLLGETLIVRPGERIALDGLVSCGSSAADEAPITGESVPVDKLVGDPVFAGSLNTIGLLEVTVTTPADDSTLARIVYLVEEAQASKAPTQMLIDRFSRYYTPIVVALAVMVWVVPVLASGSAGDSAVWNLWLYRALVVLVTACPCALVISTPVTLVSAISRAGRAGVLVKGGAFLELAAHTRAVAFDKTGTLTAGRLELTRAHAADDGDPLDVIRLAASLDAHSSHPLALAVARGARARGLALEAVDDFAELPGRGVAGMLRGRRISLVSPTFAEEIASVGSDMANRIASAEDDGLTVLVLVDDGCARGFLGVADQWRPESRAVVEALHRAGIEHTVVLTGDNERTARAVSERAGLSAYMARLLPQDKLDAVLRLKARYGTVAMVGDGMNDAPALAAADLGIAMGAAGSDTALETADVALMADDLSALPGLFALSRRTLAIIVENIVFSVGVKVVVLILAVLGMANMWLAVFADTGVALIVILNGMRLLKMPWAGMPESAAKLVGQ